ncbi:hypothetical protein ABW21_db0207157 [Orbilia brochopaga]|nr:hypothetical protein ABW21_db0207157 [Drechslerella brochopaga]
MVKDIVIRRGIEAGHPSAACSTGLETIKGHQVRARTIKDRTTMDQMIMMESTSLGIDGEPISLYTTQSGISSDRIQDRVFQTKEIKDRTIRAREANLHGIHSGTDLQVRRIHRGIYSIRSDLQISQEANLHRTRINSHLEIANQVYLTRLVFVSLLHRQSQVDREVVEVRQEAHQEVLPEVAEEVHLEARQEVAHQGVRQVVLPEVEEEDLPEAAVGDHLEARQEEVHQEEEAHQGVRQAEVVEVAGDLPVALQILEQGCYPPRPIFRV